VELTRQKCFTRKETCEILSLSPSTVDRLGERGVLRVKYLGPSFGSKRFLLPTTEDEWRDYRALYQASFAGTRKGTPRGTVAVTNSNQEP
jgi:hypothetical protein